MYTLDYDETLLKYQEKMENHNNLSVRSAMPKANMKKIDNETKARDYQEKMQMLTALMGESDKTIMKFQCPKHHDSHTDSSHKETTKSLDFNNVQQLPRSSSTESSGGNSSTNQIDTESMNSDESFYEEKDTGYIIEMNDKEKQEMQMFEQGLIQDVDTWK